MPETARPATALPPAHNTASDAAGDLLERYERHLVEDRGLAASTVVGYVAVARRFLSERASAAGDPNETGVAGLCGGVVTAFLLRECERLAVGSAKNRVTGLRSVLRFLRLEGLVATDLAAAVPPVAGWRDTRLAAGATLVVPLRDLGRDLVGHRRTRSSAPR